MGPFRVSYPSLEFKNQLRDAAAPIEACAFNEPRREFLAVDASALRVWSLKRVIKTVMAPSKVSSPAIAAFFLEKDDLYVVVYRGTYTVGTDAAPAEQGASGRGGCFVYDARLRMLCRFAPCDCEVASAVFQPSTGALVVSGRDGILRVFRISSRRLPPAPLPYGTTATKAVQVSAREIRRLDGPATPLLTEILEIDPSSGLVVGIHGNEAFLWRLPVPQESATVPSPAQCTALKVVEVPTPVSNDLGFGATERGGRYQYLGSMPDLHSSDVTAISVTEPLLATGLANGRIFLWRIGAPAAGDLKRTVLTVFDAHDAFPVLSLRLLRSLPSSPSSVRREEGSTHHSEAPRLSASLAQQQSPLSPSPIPPPPDGAGRAQQPVCEDKYRRTASGSGRAGAGGGASASGTAATVGYGDASEDWSVISGGGDGAVAHWSVVGLVSPREVARGTEEARVELIKIGEYELFRKTQGAHRASISGGGAEKGHPASESQFAASRRPGVSHIMTARLCLRGNTHSLSGCGEKARPNAALATPVGAGRPGDASRGTAPTGVNLGRSFLPVAAGIDESDRGHSNAVSGGRDFCIAVAGGLASVLEVVHPLQHVGWAGRVKQPARAGTTEALARILHNGGRRQEVLGMSRVPTAWRRGAVAAAAVEVQGEEGDGDGNDVVVMCEGGWFGWYHGCNGRFELVSRLDLAGINLDGISRNAPAATAAVDEADATCFALCPMSGRRRQASPTRTKSTIVSSRSGALASQAALPGAPASTAARVVVGYADGSIGYASMSRPMMPSTSCSTEVVSGACVSESGCRLEEQQGGSIARRFRRPDAGGTGGVAVGHNSGEAAVEAAITALCSLATPLLVVAGDADGRLGLWTTSAALPSSGSHVLWEDRAAHKGPVIAIQRVTEAPPPAPPPTLLPGVKLPPPPRTREWVVSVGSAGEVRVWEVPARWPDDIPAAALGTGGSCRSRRIGLEFCATLLINSSICSFSCALLRPPPGVVPAAGGGSGGGREPVRALEGGDREREMDGRGGRGKRRRCRAGGAGASGVTAKVEESRLYCAVGSNNGFVQAWELSLDGEKGVGDQPLWSEKTHDAVVTTMDVWGVQSSSNADGHLPDLHSTDERRSGQKGGGDISNGQHAKGIENRRSGALKNGSIVDDASSPLHPSRQATRSENVDGRRRVDPRITATECLVVSGALDRTLCVFRARFGQGLQVLRRLNVACTPKGTPGALVVGLSVGRGTGTAAGTPLEAGILLAAAHGEVTKLGITYKHGSACSHQQHEFSPRPLSGGDEDLSNRCAPAVATPTTRAAMTAAGGDHSTEGTASDRASSASERHPSWSASVAAGGASILDKVPRGRYNTPTRLHRGRPFTAGVIETGTAPGGRPLGRSSLPGGAACSSQTRPSDRRSHPRSSTSDGAITASFWQDRPPQHQQRREMCTAAAATSASDENDMVGRWECASSEDLASATATSGAFHLSATATGATNESTAYSADGTSATLASGDTAEPPQEKQRVSARGDQGDGVTDSNPQGTKSASVQAQRNASTFGRDHDLRPTAHPASAPQSSAAADRSDCGPERKGQKRLREAGGDSNGRGGVGLTRPCEGGVACRQIRKHARHASGLTPKLQPPTTTTLAPSPITKKDDYVGDVGRWQQRLGIAVGADPGASNGGGLDRENGDRNDSPREPVTTARELMGDGALREAFAARGRHKKSPVLAREVKATLKTWAPAVVEACSRAEFSAAMGGLRGGEAVSFQRVCEIAATVLESTGGVAARRSAGQAVGRTSAGTGTTQTPTAAAASRQQRQSASTGSQQQGGQHHPFQSQHRAVGPLPCRPARYHTMAKSKTRIEYNSMGERVAVRVEVGGIDAFSARARQCSSRGEDQHERLHHARPPQEETNPPPDSMEKENSVGDGDGNGTDNNGGDCSAGACEGLSVSKSLGFGWPDFSSVDSKVLDQVKCCEEDADSLARPSRASAASLGQVPAGLRTVWSRHGCCLFSSWAVSHNHGAERSADGVDSAEGTDGAAEVIGEGECVRLVREVMDARDAAEAASLVACRRDGRCPPDAHVLVVGDGGNNINDSAEGARGTEHGKAQGSKTSPSPSPSSGCPAYRVEPLGVALYERFRRRYGLQRTAEERVAGLLGAVVEYAPASAVLRLFARVLGAPPSARGLGERWPFQTLQEDGNRGLERELADFVTTARQWLTTRGFMTVDGPLTGVGNGSGGDGGGVGVGWRKAVVARTHAAMCASALLKPGWGSGHRIMGTAEQAILELPTVGSDPGLGENRRTGQRWRQPWSESVDGEAFLEALLLVVLSARELCSAAYAGLFGPKAVAGHSFLLAKARDINAPAAAKEEEEEEEEATHGARKTATKRGLESLLETVSKSLPSPMLSAALPPAVSAEASLTPAAQEDDRGAAAFRQEGDVNVAGVNESLTHGQHHGGDDSPPDANVDGGEVPRASTESGRGNGGGCPEFLLDDHGGAKVVRFRRRAEDLGEEGDVLKQLRPMLDSFIREDTQRTGTLPAAVFRRVICEGHRNLWPNLPSPVRASSKVVIPEGGAAEFVDPRLTSDENDAARALVRRFVDAFDGRVCYLDLWITLYHAVFRSGKIPPFTELPSVCEKQLLGADTEHWEALLEYFETAATEIGSPPTAGGICNKRQPGLGPSEMFDTGGSFLDQGQRSCSALQQGRAETSEPKQGEAGYDAVAKPLARGASMPTLGLLRTTTNGGAASSFCTSDATATTAAALQRLLPSAPRAKARPVDPAAVPTMPGVAAEWPRAGWGPGALTVSRPPRATAAREAVLLAPAMISALSAPFHQQGHQDGQADNPRGEVFGGGDNACVPVGDGGGGGVVGGCETVAAAAKGANERRGRTVSAEQTGTAARREDGLNKPQQRRENANGGGSVEPSEAEREKGRSHAIPRSTDDLVGSVVIGAGGVKNACVPSTGHGREVPPQTDASDPYPVTDGAAGGHHDSAVDEAGPEGQEQHHQRRRQLGEEGEANISGHQMGEEPQASSSSFDEEFSLSGGMLLYNLDSGTLEPPSPEPPSPDRQRSRDVDGFSAQLQRGSRRKKRRAKRIMTSLYVRCPFLDPVKSKHAYKVPRGGCPYVPPAPVFHEAGDPASMAAQLYSSIASSKAKQAAAAAAAEAVPADASGGRRSASGRQRRRVVKSDAETRGQDVVLQAPPGLKEAMLREGRSKSRERRRAEGRTYTPGPGGGGGRGGEEAHLAAAENRRPWTGGRQRRKSGDLGVMQDLPTADDSPGLRSLSAAEEEPALHGPDGFVLEGTATGERVVSPKASRSPPRSRGGGGVTRQPLPSCSAAASPGHLRSREDAPVTPTTSADIQPWDDGPEHRDHPHPASTLAGVDGHPGRNAAGPSGGPPPSRYASDGKGGTPDTKPAGGGRGRGKGRASAARGRPGRGRVRRGPETTGSSEDDSDEDGGGGSAGANAQKAAQQKMIEDMMAEQAAKRRASGEAMKRLIAEEDERKRLRKAEEEAARIEQEKAKRELEERQRRELEERRKALAKKRAELEEKNRQLEAERLKQEAERQAADQARREVMELRRREEAAKRAEEDRLAREEAARWAREEEARLRREEEERQLKADEAVKKAMAERERVREAGEQLRMAQEDADIDTILQANRALELEAERAQRQEDAAREAEELKAAAETAKRKHACLLMCKADDESGRWNALWKTEELEAKIEEHEEDRKAKSDRPLITRNEHGDPIDIKLWGMECTAKTDSDGRLVQRESYVDGSGGYTFDPRDVFQGEGGGVGGRGGGRGDGTTLPNPAEGEGGSSEGRGEGGGGDDEAFLDAEGFLERERRWMEGIFAASRPDDLSCLFQDSTGSSKFNPDAFFPMVLSERVAWPEYMDTVRAALAVQAEAIAKQGAALDASSGSRCSKEAVAGRGGGSVPEGSAVVSAGAWRNAPSTPASPHVLHPGGATPSFAKGAEGSVHNRSRNLNDRHQRSPAAPDYPGTREKSRIATPSGEESAETARPSEVSRGSHRRGDEGPSGVATAAATAAPAAAAASVRPLKLDETVRGTTGAGAESWSFFSFSLPSDGPVITIVLDAVDGEPELFVWRGRLPPVHSTSWGSAAPATAGGGNGEAGGVGFGVEWTASSTHRDLRVVKIFPRDLNYGAGEYFVGVMSRDIPSRFALRVSAASPVDEVSTHMRTAAAIVDNLSIMSKMDPHRLVRDFVGARLEAEQIIRKQRTASLPGDDISQPQPTDGDSRPLPVRGSTAGGPRHSDEHQPHRDHHRPERADTKLGGTSSDSRTPWVSTLGVSSVHDTAAAPAPDAGRGTRTPDGEQQQQQQQEKDSTLLTALRRRERALPTPVAVLDDRMARARPTGPLARASASPPVVSTSAVVFDSSPSTMAPVAAAKADLDGIDSETIGTHVGDFCSRFQATWSATVALTPGRFSYGQRRRRMSAPLLLPLSEGGQGGRGEPEATRPWTTANGGQEMVSDEDRCAERAEGVTGISPCRYSVRRLDHTHSHVIRLSDLRVQKAPLSATTPAATKDAAPTLLRGTALQGGGNRADRNATPAGDLVCQDRPGAGDGRGQGALEGYLSNESRKPSRGDAAVAYTARTQSAPAGDRSGARVGQEADRRRSGGIPPGRKDAIRLGIENEVAPRFSSPLSPDPSSWPSAPLMHLSSRRDSAASLRMLSQHSTLSSPSRQHESSGSRYALAEVRAERDAVAAEARQALARAEPNLFPEIIVDPPTVGRGGNDRETRGRRGWLTSDRDLPL